MSVLERQALLSTQEVAAIFGLSVKTVVGWVRDGEMAASRVPSAGGRPALLRFELTEVERVRQERQASQEAHRAEAERKEAERSRLWHERRARAALRRSWSDRHQDQLEATGTVCQEGRRTRFPIEPLFALPTETRSCDWPAPCTSTQPNCMGPGVTGSPGFTPTGGRWRSASTPPRCGARPGGHWTEWVAQDVYLADRE